MGAFGPAVAVDAATVNAALATILTTDDARRATLVGRIRALTQPPDEHVTLAGWRWRGDFDADHPPVLLQALDIGEVNQYQLWADCTAGTVTDVETYMATDHVFRVEVDATHYREYRVTSQIAQVGLQLQRYVEFEDRVAVGAIAVNAAISLILSPPFVTQSQVAAALDRANPSRIEVPSLYALDAALTAAGV